eukprot:3316470-Prymnesium_polylepis.1
MVLWGGGARGSSNSVATARAVRGCGCSVFVRVLLALWCCLRSGAAHHADIHRHMPHARAQAQAQGQVP